MSAARRARHVVQRLNPTQRLVALGSVAGAILLILGLAGALTNCATTAGAMIGLETAASAQVRCDATGRRIDANSARLLAVERAQLQTGGDVRWLVRSLDRIERYTGTARPADPPPAGVVDGGVP